MEEKVKRKSEIDLKHIKPTDLKNDVRIYPSVEATKHSEAAILTQEHAIRECMMDYYLNNPDAKTPDLSPEEESGNNGIRRRIKQGELIVTGFSCSWLLEIILS